MSLESGNEATHGYTEMCTMFDIAVNVIPETESAVTSGRLEILEFYTS